MAKWAIEWHESGLKNFKENYVRKQAELDRLNGELLRWEASILKTEMQIAEAKKRGMKGFDPEKFMKPRTPKSSMNSGRE